jgi:nudix-type nucleoside diphosphatase (YffH/AdpP family)
MKKKRFEIENIETVFDDFFKIKKATLRFERFDGRMSGTVKRLCLERGDAVAAILFNPGTGTVFLTNQFKYPTCLRDGDGWITEALAGMIDEGETPEDALRREVDEEAGFRIQKMTPIHTFFVSPGGTSERIFLYYVEVSDADRVGPGGGLASEEEDILMLEYTLPEVWELLDRGEINDAKTLIALMWLRNRLEKKHEPYIA